MNSEYYFRIVYLVFSTRDEVLFVMMFVERVLSLNLEFENVQHYMIDIEGKLNVNCMIHHDKRYVDIQIYRINSRVKRFESVMGKVYASSSG